MLDVEQRIAAMSGREAKEVLEALVYAINGESLTTPQEILREYGLCVEEEDDNES